MACGLRATGTPAARASSIVRRGSQDPREPSRVNRPIPVFGHVPGSSAGRPPAPVGDAGDRGVGRDSLVVGPQIVNGDHAPVGRPQADLRPVALLAAGERAGEAVDRRGGATRRRRVGSKGRGTARPSRPGVVERREDVAADRVVALGELLGLARVAARAVAWRHHRRDQRGVVREAVELSGRRLVALHAAHAGGRVRAAPPVVDDAGIHANGSPRTRRNWRADRWSRRASRLSSTQRTDSVHWTSTSDKRKRRPRGRR